MKSIWTSLKKHKSLFLFISILFLFGIFTGVLFYFKQDINLRKELSGGLGTLFQNNVFSFKNIFYHLLFLVIFCALLFCFLGIPALIVFLFFEGLSIGFIVPLFFSIFKINGALYFLLYLVVVKFVYLFLLFLLFVKAFSFTKTYLVCLKNKSYSFMENLKYILLFVFILLLNDLFVYFVGNKILIFLLG